MARFPIAIFMSVFFAFVLGINTFAYAESDWQRAKTEFSEEFQEFKRDGLSAQQVKQLTQKLLDAAGDDIDGTGVKTLLQTMNQQAKNTVWLMDKKATLEELIDIVGTTYALANKDAPLNSDDLVEAYKTLGKGVKLSAKLARKIPVMGKVAGPMLDAYATAIKNGQNHIEAIATATKAKNRAIASWLSEESYDAPPITNIEPEEEEAPTEEEIEWEQLREEERAQNEACMERCSKQYLAYGEIATKRARVRNAAAETSKALDKARLKANSKRLKHNDYARRLNSYLERYRNKLARRHAENERMLRAQRENRLEAYEGYKQNLSQLDESLTMFRINIRDDFASFTKVKNDYLQSKSDISKVKLKYETRIREYEAADTRYRIAIKTYEDCITKCKNELAALNLNGLWNGGENVYRINHTGKNIRIIYQTVSKQSRQSRGYKPGDLSFFGQLEGRIIKGQIKLRYPLTMKDACGALWEIWQQIEITVSNDNSRIFSYLSVQDRDENSCEPAETKTILLDWTRVGD